MSSVDTPRPCRPRQLGMQVALVIGLCVWLLPLAGVALTSFRSAEDLNRGNYWGWPTEFSAIENYAAVFTLSPMGTFLFNSLVIAIPSVVGTVAVSCMAGFVLAKYRFPGNTILFAVFIAGNFVPSQILMIPVRNLMVSLDLYNTRWALVLFHIAFQTGFCTLFMRNFIRQLPASLFETARLEGLGGFRVLWYIVLPLLRPAIAGVSVLIFTFIWNDYFWGTVLVHSDDVRTITAGLQTLRGMWTTSYHLMAAGAILAAVPPVALFFFMQREFIAGLTLGSGEE